MERAESAAVDREILRPLWKIHILYHAGERPVLGHWMLEELREHGYKVSPGTLYPLLRRLQRLGWLAAAPADRPGGGGGTAVAYTLTPAGKDALAQVRRRLEELVREVLRDF